MSDTPQVKKYNTRTFTDRYMPSDELKSMYRGDIEKFLIVPVEEMYKHVHKSVPPSRATNHTFIYLTEGEGYMKIGSDEYRIHQHEMLCVPAGQIFSFEAYDTTKYNKGFLCNFNDSMLAGKFGKIELVNEFEFLNVWGNHSISLGEEISAFVGQLLKRILVEYAKSGLQHIDLVQSYLLALLCEIRQVYLPLFNSRQTAAVKLTNSFKDVLFSNITSKHMVTDYASMLNVTPNHLNKAIKSTTAKSPTRWIDETIVLEAKVLLYQTTLSVNEIASAIGITDPSYFSRLFKKYEGITPLEFRKKIEMS
ncbi:MAG: helix-turn-helix transcriptional regulator [Flavipsychrobacter sp.]|nr:helix-turn-helix transcriptional regulator [Flavipsychrobacter sp.]